MADRSDSKNDATADAGGAGCVVFLIDESTAMDTRVADGTKSKADCIATALNSLLNQLPLLNQLTGGPDLEVALVGYRGDGRGGIDVGCRWGGPLEGRMFVQSSQLPDAPVTVENRVRKIPGLGGVGTEREETVAFPVWYAPVLGDAGSPAGAYEYCRGLLSARVSAPKPPLVVSFVGELSPESSLSAAVAGIQQMQLPAGPPLVFHAHLSSLARVPPTLYPSADNHLPPGAVREIFQSSSPLPDPLVVVLRQWQVTVNPGARGMIYNAKMAEMIRFLSLVKEYVKYRAPVAARAAAKPQAVDDSAATEAVALVVLLLDRSAGDPSDEGKQKAWTRLQERANELLRHVSKHGKGLIEVAVVSCGADADGRSEVQTEFAGPLAGRTFVPDTDLADGALRVEEVTEQVSNGIGGLIEVTRKRPIFVDLEPAEVAAVVPAFQAAGELVGDWCGRHPGSPAAPIVLHLTRGRLDPDQLQQAADRLRQVSAAAGNLLLYHLVVTESPHRSLAYPGRPEEIEDPILLKLWELSSPLLGSRRLAAEKPAVAAESRGIVINGRFDLLLDGVLDCMQL